MRNYLLRRLIRSVFSLFIVISAVFVLIYSLIPQERVFLSDANIEKLQKNPDHFLSYKNSQLAKLGYIEFDTIHDYCLKLYEAATKEYNACILPNSHQTQSFIATREATGFTISTFPVSGKAIATRDIPNWQRIFNWWKHLIEIDHPQRVQSENLLPLRRRIHLGRDFNNRLAIMCFGCENKYLVYGNHQFPFIHQNVIRLNLGISYPTYSGQEVLNVLTGGQGRKVLKEVRLSNGEIWMTALDLHTCRFKDTLDDLERKIFLDHYADCDPHRDGPSMMGISFTMGVIALVLSYGIGLSLGVRRARYQGKLFDKIGGWYVMVMMAVPSLAYIVLVRFLGGRYFGLPTMFPLLGAHDPRSYLLPIVSLTIGGIAGRMMWMRRYMIDQISMDYVKFARAKGLTENEIFSKHIFKNAIGPIAHGLPGAIIFSISGALMTEAAYSIPGMGKTLPDAINTYNNSMVIGITFIFTMLAIVSTLLGDLLLIALDPRISLRRWKS